jgi:hypothetical protein
MEPARRAGPVTANPTLREEDTTMLQILIAILGAFAGRLATNHNTTVLRG